MVLEGEINLKAGDVVIQRDTNHAWSNRSDNPVRMLYILIDSKLDRALAVALGGAQACSVCLLRRCVGWRVRSVVGNATVLHHAITVSQ